MHSNEILFRSKGVVKVGLVGLVLGFDELELDDELLDDDDDSLDGSE